MYTLFLPHACVQTDLASLTQEQAKMVGYQRLRATQYDELRRQAASGGVVNIPSGQVRQGMEGVRRA